MRLVVQMSTTVAILGTLVAAQTSDSGSAAVTLVQTLQARQLDAIAVADPQKPGRYLAALFVAPSQLLVVGAEHDNAAALAAAIDEHRYRDVYIDLQTARSAKDKLFVHDLGADGLVRAGKSVIDNVYQDGARAELASTRSGAERFRTLDAEYARMLRALTGALGQASPASPTAAAPGLARH